MEHQIYQPGGRVVMIADEIGPGRFAMDIHTSVVSAKVAIIGLTMFKQACKEVSDEMERREILNQYDEIMKQITGKAPEKEQPKDDVL